MRFVGLVFLFSLITGNVWTQTQTVGLFTYEVDESYNGYTLFAPTLSNITYLIDNCGYQVHQWETSYNPGLAAYLLPDGNLLRSARIPSNFAGGGSGGRLELLSWDSELLWAYDFSTEDYHQHHDIEPLPNGNILILAWDRIDAQLAAENGVAINMIGPQGIWLEKIMEVRPIGTSQIELVWEWRLWDHIVQDINPQLPNYGDIAQHPELVNVNFGAGVNQDRVHANSIQYNSVLDQIVISARNFSEIWVIDHSTTTEEAATHTGGLRGKGGDILYRWGNPRAYNRDTGDSRQLFLQHDARWIPEGYPNAGNIMIFNNGVERPDGNYSSVEIIIPPMDSLGNYVIDSLMPFGPQEPIWSYGAAAQPPFSSRQMSGADQLPNGNILVCVANDGYFFEVTPNKAVVWEYVNPIRRDAPIVQGVGTNQNDVFRVARYGVDYVAFEGKDLTPIAPLEAQPIAYECTTIPDTITTVSAPGSFSDIRVVNNPFDTHLGLEKKGAQYYDISVFSLSGKPVFQTVCHQTMWINTHTWQKGVYILFIKNQEMNTFATQKIIKL